MAHLQEKMAMDVERRSARHRLKNCIGLSKGLMRSLGT